MLQQFLVLFHVIISIALIILVLLQQGKGAELGATFGSAASQTVFGSQGSGSFLLKLTGLLALLFFTTSLSLCYLAAHLNKQDPIQKLANLAQQSPLPVNQVSDKTLASPPTTGNLALDDKPYPTSSNFPQ
ncbi:MAG: preprotein translocase subunit SecG [Candidatus Aquirickettsiella gammari]|uniref:Protein-export membrane protein SecG n=1 Tax=Candidatus Aquirickettsiella gammari TaxID=2016198 RepID=A0A370CIB3_9COXI|nr:MAG: preprotein translocase subunit SecG [Candidatus Aquirickettsiella gammari]